MPGEHDNERPGAVARHQQFSRLMCGSFVGRFSPSNQIGGSNLAVAWRSAMHSSCCRGVFSFKGGTTINSVFVSARYVVALAAAVLCTSTTSGGDRSGLRLQLAGGGRLGKSRWLTTGTSRPLLSPIVAVHRRSVVESQNAKIRVRVSSARVPIIYGDDWRQGAPNGESRMASNYSCHFSCPCMGSE